MSTSIIIAAAQLAARYHQNQKRKTSGRPYITHPIRVAGRVATLPGMEDADVAASFLHDGPEDQAPTTEKRDEMHTEILQACGQKTLDLVMALTNPSKGMNLPRAERKQMDREHLKGYPVRVKRIKLVDRIDNLHETISDILLGIDHKRDFNLLYAAESEQLLEEALRGADPELEKELTQAIANLRLAVLITDLRLACR